jgi:hypothetical protein
MLPSLSACSWPGGFATPPPPPDNDNWRLMEEWRTPAELIQWIRRTQEEMRQELIDDASLFRCPKYRRHWNSLRAIERCARWHYYRKPGDA